MIPVRLQLQNFMSYGDGVPPLSLEGIHLACLSGENGHGKSALLDALTWALWGRARTNHDDELMRVGATEMQVEFDFELGGGRYRALRRRVRKGRTGVSTLEFQILDGEDVRPLTGNSIADTQRKITELLHLDYETFINSAYLRQGRADQFTLKSPAERKEVLATILGLTFYDDLSERARATARQCEADRRDREGQVTRIDEELSRQSEYEEALAGTANTISRLEAELGELDARLELLRHQQRDLDARAEELTSLRQQCQRGEAALRELVREIAAHQDRIAERETLLSRRSEVEEGYALWLAARQEETEANQRLSQVMPLQEQRAKLEQAVEAARQGLLAEQRSVANALRPLQEKLAQVPKWEAEADRVRQRLEDLGRLEQEREDALELLRATRSQTELLRTSNGLIEAQGNELDEKLSLLKNAEAACPLCNSELGPEERDQLCARMNASLIELRKQYARNVTEIKQMEGRAASTQSLIADLERGLKDRGPLQRREGELQRLKDEAREAQEEANRQQACHDEAQARLSAADYARSEQQQIADILHQIEALGYDPQAHAQARGRAASYAKYERLKNEMELAEKLLAAEQQALSRAQADAESRRTDLEAAHQREAHLEAALAERPAVVQGLGRAEAERSQRHQSWSEALDRRGRLQQLLDHCHHLAEQRRRLVAEQSRLGEDKTLYDELAYAYGKNGIQAMLIEGVLPELEREANTLLDRMTEGRMRVRFETQRMAKAKDQAIETLDIKIADELGTRPYELYSGGEAFRANFAIRVALSKLLARRAGARLQTLIIDEGFGTQDTLGRERLVEAINSISQDFERILVITHIDELKDAFPVRIEVTKTAEGSQFTVNPA